MKEHIVEQGTAEWRALRLGIPTASEFHKIVTPAKCELSKQARGYAFRLVAQRLLRETFDTLDGQEWVERGKELEPLAVQQYAFTQDVEVRPVGFITTDDGRFGASPDRLVVGHPVGVEIKCPAPWTHLEYWVDGRGAEYQPQVQGQLLVAELEAVDFYSFHPRMPPYLQRTVRDDAYIGKLQSALEQFWDMAGEIELHARETGFFEERARVVAPVDDEYAEVGW